MFAAKSFKISAISEDNAKPKSQNTQILLIVRVWDRVAGMSVVFKQEHMGRYSREKTCY